MKLQSTDIHYRETVAIMMRDRQIAQNLMELYSILYALIYFETKSQKRYIQGKLDMIVDTMSSLGWKKNNVNNSWEYVGEYPEFMQIIEDHMKWTKTVKIS